MKKILSAITSAVLSAVLITANLGDASGSVYNNSSPDERTYCCIVKLDGDPLAKYDYAKQNGVDEFIFTSEGQEVYSELMGYHDDIILWISTCLGRNVERIYDYTAVYNGFSVVLSDSEYENLCHNKEGMGITEIYKAEPYIQADSDKKFAETLSNTSYADMTNKILKQTGISNVEGKGNSTVISVIDGGFDSSHEFISIMPDDAEGRIDPEYVNDVAPYLSATSGNGNDFYYNKKIPFKFNYYTHSDNTADASDAEVLHGTHVAGIAGGNGDIETDPVYDPKGAAPEAQLLLMSTRTRKTCVMAAFDDSAYLGADVVNMSFGNDYWPVSAEPFTNEALINLSGVGAMLCVAAGNASKIQFTGESSLLNMDYSAGGTPDGIASVLSVASAENIVVEKKAITAGNENYVVMSDGTYDVFETFADKTVEMEIIPGVGSSEDFKNIDVKGKIAVIKRGTITFEEKALNALMNGAVGVIFCNNVEEEFSTNVACSALPSCILSLEEGERLMASGETKVTFNSENKLFTNMHSSISNFSSWGFTENLILKPDITAYGGCIVSSLPGGKYGVQSGTSMASPQAAGMSALLKEYLENNKEKYEIENDSDYPELMARLLMSTAVPVYNNEGSAPASPRVQGSGLANIENAVNTPAYLYTDSKEDNFRPKLSLGDELEINSGNIEFCAEKFNFHIKNISDKKLTYKLSAEILRDSESEGNLSFNVVPMTDSRIKFMLGMSETDTVTVMPGEDIVVNAELKISDEDVNYINETFKNGTFIDGFIYLKSDSAPELSLPFTGYYGSWNKGDIFEQFAYDDFSKPVLNYSFLGDSNGNFAGINVIQNAETGELKAFMPYYSPNGDNILDDICLRLSFQRRCKNIKAEIFRGNKNIHTEVFSPGMGYLNTKGYNEYRLNWKFDNASEDDLYTLRVTAETPFSENGSNREFITQEFSVDLTPPTVSDCRELDINGEKYMLINSSDNVAVQGAVMNDGFDYNYCSKNNPSEHYAVLKLPDDISDANAVVYDIAGNSKEITADDMNDDKYTLTYGDKLYFSTKDPNFKKKIIMKDKKGNDVKYSFSCTPEKAYKEGITEVSVLIDFSEIVTVPVSVGLAGDADNNGVVNLYDAIKIAKHLIWETNPNGALKNDFKDFKGSLSEYLADYNGNGSIDLYDAVGIAKLLISSSK